MGIFDTTSTQSGVPWQPLQEPVLGGVDYATNLLNRGTYQGPYTAAINPYQTQGINSGYQNAGTAGGVGSAYGNAGQMLQGGLGSAYQYNQNALGGSQNPWMTNPAMYFGLANQTANNPYLEGQITAALRDPYRQLTEQTLPGIGQSANMVGQSAGSRRGIAEGIANRGYADRASDLSSQMRGAAYGQGLDYANQAANNDYSAQQNAAMNLGNFGNQGLNYLGQQYGYGQQGATDQAKWGTQQQELENQQIQGQMNAFNAPWNNLQSYGSYLNPLAQNLQLQTSNQDMLAAYALQGLGPILGNVGGNIGNEVSDWLFGTLPEGGGSRSGGIFDKIGGWF